MLVLVEIEGNLVPKSGWMRGEKSCVYTKVPVPQTDTGR